MPPSHRDTDSRSCGASTIVSGQSFVKINGKLWAVENDKESHGNGQLIATQHYVKIGGLAVILKGDNANPDNLMHSNPSAQGSDSTVNVNF